MGPRQLLLVAAGLSLCGPLLSARTRGRNSGKSCPGCFLPAHPRPRSWGLLAWGRREEEGRCRGTKWVQVASAPKRGCPRPHALPTVSFRSQRAVWAEVQIRPQSYPDGVCPFTHPASRAQLKSLCTWFRRMHRPANRVLDMEGEGVGSSWGSLRCLIAFVITVSPRTTPKKESHIAPPVNLLASSI